MIHPCECKAYNVGQCFNCLNGAHGLCRTCGKANAINMGLTIVVKGGRVTKTRYADINKPECEHREYRVTRTGMERPSSRIVYIECPFCKDEVKCYVWSISGGGKRCGCGALLSSTGEAHKMPERKPS